MIKTIDDFRHDLGRIESSGNYKNGKNTLGFMGKYQMGEASFADAEIKI